ncbi:MAG: type 4a pilus biogenesis protein PilO [Candidatus Omnitrophica bacterium]|nr:type 4a pilus biogenesis protein PilO [Candidatus Omnitrophota bacterium]MDD5770984.1 type 4a pilus biogenesis protein PilO [Candidatus Omnitrophota bacterium]
MISMDFFSEYKDKIINAAVMLLAVFVAFYLYGLQNQQLSSLEESKNEEARKSEIIESLNRVEKRINSYKKTFTGKDLGSVIDAMTEIAKDTGVKVISVKPGSEHRESDYTRSSFLIVVRAADYHALGNFISRLENYKDLFLIEDLNISAVTDSMSGRKLDSDLDVSLKISAITCF